jgi:DNA-binding NarL/FixJ family response regulator
MPIDIIILDDHPLLVRGLKTMLESTAGISVSATFQRGKDLIKYLPGKTTDILLLDISLPDISGIEVLSQVRNAGVGFPVLFVTNLESRYYIKAAIEQGAAGYVLKSSSETILLNAIHIALAGGRFFDPSIQETVAELLKDEVRKTKAKVVLSKRELEVLKYIAGNLTSAQIADKLYVSKRTVDFHRMNLLIKLEASNAAFLVKRAVELGLIE